MLTRLGRDASYARGHRETSTTGKIDPSFIDLDAMRADVAAAMGGTRPPATGTPFRVYEPDVNVRPTPATTGAPVGNLGAPGTVYVVCQTVGQTVTANGYTNNRWSKISSPVAGYVSNVFIEGPASLPGRQLLRPAARRDAGHERRPGADRVVGPDDELSPGRASCDQAVRPRSDAAVVRRWRRPRARRTT